MTPALRTLEALLGAMRPKTRRARVAATAIALALFGGGAYLAASRSALELRNIEWSWILLAGAVGVPIGLGLNAFEVLVAARVARRSMGFGEGLRISVLASAANLLPLPGGALVRVSELSDGERGLRGALGGTAFIGLVWVSVTCVMGGVVLLAGRAFAGAAVLAVIAIATFASAIGLAFRSVRSRALVELVITAVGLELVFAAVFGLRMWACAKAIGAHANIGQGMVLGVSAALASVVGIFPGGLGLGEGLAAVLGPLSGLPASVSFLAAGLSRLLGIVVQAPFVVALLRSRD